MRKLKFLLLALAATISMGAWAQEWTDITYVNVTTSEDNLLGNPSFETLGSVKSGTQYNIGEPWTWNISNANIRVEKGKTYANMNGESVLIWRGSGNSWYISQSVSGIKPNTWYEVKMSQVDCGNANADFNVGIGTEAGKYDVSHTIVRLGTNNNGVKKVYFLTSSTAKESAKYYFTFANTPNNTASSGSDPVTQLDWISLVECCEDGYFSNPLDVTHFLTNPSFETGNLNGWVNDGMQTQNNDSFNKKNGTYYAEKWQEADKGGLPNCSILQTINNIPNGLYKLTVAAGFDGEGAYIVANESKKEFYANDDYSVVVNVIDGELTVGVKLENSTANYVRFDNFRLEYFGNTLQASKDDPIDLTSCIGTNQKSWTGATGVYSNCVEHFIWGGTATGEYLSQTVSNLPIGKYVVEMYCAASSTSSRDNEGKTLIDPDGSEDYVTLNANEVSKNIPAYNRLEVTNIPSYTLENVTVSDGTLKLSVNILKANPNWIVANIKSLKYIGPGLDELNMILSGLITNAESLYDSKMNSDVLQALKDKVSEARSVGQEVNAIKAIIEELQTAIANAKVSIADYAKLKDAIDLAKKYTVVNESYTELGTAITAAEGIYNDGTVESCAETIAGLDEAVKTAKVADYTYVSSTYSYLVELGTWSETGSTGKMTGQHWSGDNNREYLEQSSAAWGQDSWNLGYSQDVTLPAGNYVFKVAGRKAPGDGCTLSLVVKKGEDVIGSVSDFPDGDTGLGINKAGATSFDSNDEAGFANSNNGRGFQWRYVKFTLEEDAKVNVAVTANATTSHQWVSFCDATIQTDNEANLAMIAYNIALNDAKLALDNDAYKNVTGSELTALNTAIAFETEGKTKDQIEAATTELQEATSAFMAAAPAYDAFVAILAKVENLDDAGKAKFNELEGTVISAYNDHTVKAADLDVYDSYIAAVKAQTTPNTDWTVLIKNNSFETGNIDGWENDGDVKLGALNTSPPNNPKVGDWFVEKYWGEGSIDFNQTINDLPVGYYKVTVHARNEADAKAYLYANDEKVAFVKNTTDTYSVNVVIAKTGDLKIGVSCENHINGVWLAVDNFTLTYLGTVFDATMTKVGDAAYSSMYLDFPVEIPENVEAYYVTVSGKTATMNPIEDVIPANCGVILKAAKDVDKVTFTQTSTEATTDVSSNVLIGFVVDTEVAASDNAHYAFSYKTGDTKPAFYIPESAESDTDPTSAFTAKAHKAYIELESAPNSKLDIAWGGEATGINTIDNGQLTIDNSKAYNLNGIRVNPSTGSGQAYKGIVLKGGKKFLQK